MARGPAGTMSSVGATEFFNAAGGLLKSPGRLVRIGWGTSRSLRRRTDIKDGLSNTLFMSEILQAATDGSWDFRGDIFNCDLGGAQFMTMYTPNSGVDSLACYGPTPNDPDRVRWGATST